MAAVPQEEGQWQEEGKCVGPLPTEKWEQLQHMFLNDAQNYDDHEGLVRVAIWLHRYPAVVNAQPKKKNGGWRWSALHQAAESGNVESVKLLLEFGADKEAKAYCSKRKCEVTPLDVAKKQGVIDELKKESRKSHDRAEVLACAYLVAMEDGIMTKEGRASILTMWEMLDPGMTLIADVKKKVMDHIDKKRGNFLRAFSSTLLLRGPFRGVGELLCPEFTWEYDVDPLIHLLQDMEPPREAIVGWAFFREPFFDPGNLIAMVSPLKMDGKVRARFQLAALANHCLRRRPADAPRETTKLGAPLLTRATSPEKDIRGHFSKAPPLYRTLASLAVADYVVRFVASIGLWLILASATIKVITVDFYWRDVTWLLLGAFLLIISGLLPLYKRAMLPRVPLLTAQKHLRLLHERHLGREHFEQVMVCNCGVCKTHPDRLQQP